MEKFNSIRSIKKTKLILTLTCLVVCLVPCIAFADQDPMTAASNKMATILFGALGTSLCCIIIGGTFIMAKAGKVTWDKFISIGLYTAGFLGTPTIVAIIRAAVGH